MKPYVSIVIPVYNAGEVLRTCLDSCFAQTYPSDRFEVIVADDCSTDGLTLNICREYVQRFPSQMQVLALPENTGIPSTPRNEAISAAKGEWLFFLDGDDWLGPEAIERAVRHAQEWGSDLVLCRTMRAESGRMVGYVASQRKGLPSIPDADPFTCFELHETSNVIGRMVRKALVTENKITFKTVYPEDAAWFYEACFSARRCSLANDYDYYFLRREAGVSTVSTGAFRALPIKGPEGALAGVREAFAAYARGVGNRVSLPALRKLIRTTMRNALKRVAEWADAFPDELPDGGRAYCEMIVDIVRPFVGEDCRLQSTPRLLGDEAQRAHRVAAHDLRSVLTLEECVMLDCALAGEYRWWSSGLVLQAKNSVPSSAPKLPEEFGAWAADAQRVCNEGTYRTRCAEILSDVAFEGMAEKQVRSLELLPYAVAVEDDSLVIRGVARSLAYVIPCCEGDGGRDSNVESLEYGLSFHVALRKKGVDISGEFCVTEGAWGIAGQRPLNWEARFALDDLIAEKSKLLVLKVDVLFGGNLCRAITVGSGEHVDLLGRHVIDLERFDAPVEVAEGELAEGEGISAEVAEDEVSEDKLAEGEADPGKPLVLGAVLSRVDNRFTVTTESSLEERLAKSELLLQVKTTLQKRNEEIAALKEERKKLCEELDAVRAELAAAKDELKEERESHKGGLFSRLGKR